MVGSRLSKASFRGNGGARAAAPNGGANRSAAHRTPAGQSAAATAHAKHSTRVKFVWLDVVATDPQMRGVATSLACVYVNRYVNGRSFEAWPGAYALADILRADRTTVIIAQKKLAAAGYLTKLRDGGSWSQRATAKYRISVPTTIREPGPDASKREKQADYVRHTSGVDATGTETVSGSVSPAADSHASLRDTPTSSVDALTSGADDTAPVAPAPPDTLD